MRSMKIDQAWETLDPDVAELPSFLILLKVKLKLSQLIFVVDKEALCLRNASNKYEPLNFFLF